MTRLPRCAPGSRVFAALLLVSMGCGTTKAPPRDGSSPPASVDRITDDPDDFTGARVRLTARVAEVIGSRIFTLKDEDPVVKEQLLAVARRPLAAMLGEGGAELKPNDKVLVTGVVRPGDLAAIEGELDLDFDAKLEQRFRGKPVLVVSEVVRTDDRGPASPDTLNPGY